MKKSLLAIAGALFSGVIALSSCSQSGGTSTPSLTSKADSASYAIGMNFGGGIAQNLESIPSSANIDKEILVAAMTNSILAEEGDVDLMDTETAQKVVQSYFEEIQKIESEKNVSEGKVFLDKNLSKEGVKVTESGLQYEVIEEGTGAQPVSTDKVTVHYTGTVISGETFDSSVERGEPAQFVLNQVIPGWTEGLQLMKEGAKYKFYIPSELAYGERGMPNSPITPNSTLIFEVELIKVGE